MPSSYCEHCGTRLNGKYGMASRYGSVEYPLEYEADCAHTETRCREALKARVDALEAERTSLRKAVLDVAGKLRARDRGTQRGLQWAFDAANAIEDACGVERTVKKYG